MPRKESIPNTPAEQQRFEILLEEIRGQLKLVCEAQQASVERDSALDAKMDRIYKDFYQFVSNVHGELSARIDNVHKELSVSINEVKEILIAHDRRIGTLEHT